MMRDNNQVNVNCWSKMHNNHHRGFTLLELAVVVLVTSMIGFVGLGFYRKLLIDIERTAMEQNLNMVRSALAMQFATLYIAGEKDELAQLSQHNPMELMEELPDNYLGEVDFIHRKLKNGSWYYDKERKHLVYLVRNHRYFETELNDPPRAAFALSRGDRAEQSGQKQKNTEHLAVPKLESVTAYQWRRPWD